jgi:hypothetical protein
MKQLLLLSFIFLGCANHKKHKATLIKQWHLSPSQETMNVEKSRHVPQYKNQKEIYLNVEQMILNKETSMVLAEGCEGGEINDDFIKVYNGWTLKKLKEQIEHPHFESIMAPVQMKIKAKYPDVTVLCADDAELIEENLLAFSEIKGHLSFYQALKEYKKTSNEKYLLYSNKLKELYPNEIIKDPMNFSLSEAIRNLDLFEQIILKRNKSFNKKIQVNLSSDPVLIVGGLHVKDLGEKLSAQRIPFNVLTPINYNNEEQVLLKSLKKILQKERKVKVIYYQVPELFEITQFVFKNLIDREMIFSQTESTEIVSIVESVDLDSDLLLSDYDGDGIRDFTLSRGSESVIIAAEDSDWDNDGIDNLLDESLGDKIIIRKFPKLIIDNNYLSQTISKDVLEWYAENNIHLSQGTGSNQEKLVLDVFKKLLKLKSFENNSVKHLRSVKSQISYGEKVFFSYIRQSQTIEYYPEKLLKYLDSIKKQHYQSYSSTEFITGYVLPLIIHSASHELSHSLPVDNYAVSKEFGWSWKEGPYKGKYLKAMRATSKKITTIREDYKYKNMQYSEWITKFNNYLKQKDLLLDENLASIYSLQSPSEWFAENYAMCVFKEIYSEKYLLKSKEIFSKLLGINPIIPQGVCNRLMNK